MFMYGFCVAQASLSSERKNLIENTMSNQRSNFKVLRISEFNICIHRIRSLKLPVNSNHTRPTTCLAMITFNLWIIMKRSIFCISAAASIIALRNEINQNYEEKRKRKTKSTNIPVKLWINASAMDLETHTICQVSTGYPQTISLYDLPRIRILFSFFFFHFDYDRKMLLNIYIERA